MGVEQMAALATDYDAAVAAHPELFQPGAKYGLLGPDFGQYYMHGFSTIRAAGGISGASAVVYNGQYRVPEIALELHQFLERVERDAWDFAGIGVVRGLAAEWLQYMDQANDTVKLRGVGPYIALVEQRFATDLAKLVSLGMAP
jgi:hypothetical protein